MSTAGTDEVVFGVDDALAARALDHHLGVERDERRRGVGRVHRHAPVGVENRVLAIDRRRRVRVADVAAGPVAGPPAAVVPAARVLRHVAADGPLIADLRRGHELGRLHQQPELVAHHRIAHDLRERRARADLEATVQRLDAAQALDLAQIDDDARALDAILQPVEGIQSARHHPGVRAVAIQQRQRVADARRLKELECRHDVVNHGHDVSLFA